MTTIKDIYFRSLLIMQFLRFIHPEKKSFKDFGFTELHFKSWTKHFPIYMRETTDPISQNAD
jgi:hypothetical protein